MRWVIVVNELWGGAFTVCTETVVYLVCTETMVYLV